LGKRDNAPVHQYSFLVCARESNVAATSGHQILNISRGYDRTTHEQHAQVADLGG
jgi:hypothetical protein